MSIYFIILIVRENVSYFANIIFVVECIKLVKSFNCVVDISHSTSDTIIVLYSYFIFDLGTVKLFARGGGDGVVN